MVRPHTPRAEARQTQRLALGFKATQRDVIPSHAKAFQGRQALPKPSHNRVAANQPKLVAGQFALARVWDNYTFLVGAGSLRTLYNLRRTNLNSLDCERCSLEL